MCVKIELKKWCLCVALLLFQYQGTALSQQEAMPSCPAIDIEPYPGYSDLSELPNVAVWHDLSAIRDNCSAINLSGTAKVVGLASYFHYTGTVEELASRAGAISALKDLNYWSITDNSWRKLISNSVALNSVDSKDKRPDFSGSEVMRGQTLYFAQDDTRAWGMNIYSLTAIEVSNSRLVVTSENISPIKIGPITLFKPRSIKSLTIVSEVDKATWSYYSLISITDSFFDSKDKSLINRQAAAYRFLVGKPSNAEPPLAP